MAASRRDFLLRSAAVFAAAHSASAFAAPSASPTSRPGIQMFMVAAAFRKDPAGTLAALASIGYGYVEAFSMLTPDLGAFRRMVADAGLAVPVGHFPFGTAPTEKVLDDANTLGVHYAISSILPPHPPTGSDFSSTLNRMNNLTADDFKRMADLANQIGESASKRGLAYAYHNHNFEFRRPSGPNGPSGYEILLRETNPRFVHFEVDAGWMAAAGANPAAIIAAHPDRVRLLHFKDFSTITPPIDQLGGAAGAHIVDLGTGVVPLRAAYRAARKAGVRYFLVDHDPPFHGQTVIEAARSDFRFVSGLMAS